MRLARPPSLCSIIQLPSRHHFRHDSITPRHGRPRPRRLGSDHGHARRRRRPHHPGPFHPCSMRLSPTAHALSLHSAFTTYSARPSLHTACVFHSRQRLHHIQRAPFTPHSTRLSLQTACVFHSRQRGNFMLCGNLTAEFVPLISTKHGCSALIRNPFEIRGTFRAIRQRREAVTSIRKPATPPG